MKKRWMIILSVFAVSASTTVFAGGKQVPKAMEDSSATFLFVQNATGVSYGRAKQLLTLDGINPLVTFFADRPERVAGHVLLPGFIDLWAEGADSFKSDPPNASLSIFDGKVASSVIVEIANPQVKGTTLTYDVVQVLDGELPASGGVCSLFIDGLFSGGAVGGGAKGAIGGALIGAISGDAGKGAAIGAGVGVVGGALKKRGDEKAAEQAQLTTRVVNVSNPNGSVTPVTLHLVKTGWQGPKGEIYPTLPTEAQLSSAYGVK